MAGAALPPFLCLQSPFFLLSKPTGCFLQGRPAPFGLSIFEAGAPLEVRHEGRRADKRAGRFECTPFQLHLLLLPPKNTETCSRRTILTQRGGEIVDNLIAQERGQPSFTLPRAGVRGGVKSQRGGEGANDLTPLPLQKARHARKTKNTDKRQQRT